MQLTSPHLSPHAWPAYPVPDDSIPAYSRQSNQSGWLLGNLQGQAPPAVWTGLPHRPHVEEYVPPNPPQALGSGHERMLVWPTPAQRRAPSDFHRSNIVEDAEDRSNLMQLPFFRRQVLKYDQEAQQDSKPKPESDPIVANADVTRIVDWDMEGVPHSERRSNGVIPNAFCDGHVMLRSPQRRLQTTLDQAGRQRKQCQAHNAQVHVQNEGSGAVFTIRYNHDLPKDSTSTLPKLVRPANPEQLQSTLQMMKSNIIYARYTCDAECRSRGICVHFSAVFGGSTVPDGLICQKCRDVGKEKEAHYRRDCPRHPQYADRRVCLPEDILATEAQSVQAHKILARAVGCNWEGIPLNKGHIRTRNAPSQTAVLPIRTLERPSVGRDVSRSSINTNACDEQPDTKKVKLDAQDVGVKQAESVNDNFDDPARYVTDFDGEFTFDNMLATEFPEFAGNPNEALGNDTIQW